MIGIKIGKVIEILKKRENITEIMVEIKEKKYKAINYNKLTGSIQIEDQVLLNTTAVDLNLGTGGYHFVISNLNIPEKDITNNGHIMKLRYSPYQIKTFAAEEQTSKYHEVFNDFKSLDKMPVIIGSLHSMLVPITAVLKTCLEEVKIAYIMTDGAALPIDLSNVVYNLKNKKIISNTITIGNSFGGDLECVNIYNGLIAAKEVLKADIAVITMGPGIVGTGTKYGFSGIEQGYMIDAVNDLGGTAIAVPRISFADSRNRHKGMSHHSLTVLNQISKTSAFIPIPKFENEKYDYIKSQIENTNIGKKHNIMYLDYVKVINILENTELNMSTMGRKFDKDKEYFITAGIAGQLGAKILSDHQ
ncbi:DUF3866 family protein [Lutibacter sp. B2]|nr:DUF3866 family protein [Lutibacter sp. B2]